jgi:hypothetical protein
MHFTMEMERYVPPKHWYLPANPHGVTTQKTDINIFAAVRIADLRSL